MVFESLRRMGFREPNGHTVKDLQPKIATMVKAVTDDLIAITDKLYPDAYLAVLFKNNLKCKEIAKKFNEDSLPKPKPMTSLFDD